MEIIKLEYVTKLYGEKKALDNVNFSVKKGELLTVIGRSGCGKTTLIKTINRLCIPDLGKVFIEGEDISTEDAIDLRRHIGYVLQNKGLFPHMTVEKNITYVPVISGKKNKEENRDLAKKLLKTVGLDESLLERYPRQLSGGEQQRVGIARALAAGPKIILMDEPFASLDEITKKSMQDEILNIHKDLGVTIIFVTHDIDEAMKLGDRVLVMDDGKIQQLDKPENIKSHPKNEAVAKLIGV